MKKFVVVLLALVMVLSLCMTASARDDVKAIIEEAQGMTLEELAKKAIEESNGKMFYGVGNSNHGIRMAAAEEQQDLRSADR